MNLVKSYSDTNQIQGLSKFYIIATPIGNLKDITIRALEALKEVDWVVCEDTRQTNKLLTHYNIKKSMLCYNDNSGTHDRDKIIALLQSGKNLALVSDAGTPLISDPGYKLINAVREAGFYVTSLPGPCAAITALTLSGLPSDNFYFAGFLPAKEHAWREAIKNLVKINSTIIIYESAKRLKDAIKDIASIFENSNIAICRELTRKFEEVITGSPIELLNYLNQRGELKGEIVLLINNHNPQNNNISSVDFYIEIMADKIGAKQTSQVLSELLSLPKRDIYNRILELKQNGNN